MLSGSGRGRHAASLLPHSASKTRVNALMGEKGRMRGFGSPSFCSEVRTPSPPPSPLWGEADSSQRCADDTLLSAFRRRSLASAPSSRRSDAARDQVSEQSRVSSAAVAALLVASTKCAITARDRIGLGFCRAPEQRLAPARINHNDRQGRGRPRNNGLKTAVARRNDACSFATLNSDSCAARKTSEKNRGRSFLHQLLRTSMSCILVSWRVISAFTRVFDALWRPSFFGARSANDFARLQKCVHV